MFDLIKCFTKVGILGFGGGSAVAPLIKNEAVKKHGWITDDEFLEIVALANSLPGPSMAQMAAAVGYRKAGIKGAIVSAISIIMPMVLIFTFLMINLIKFVSVENIITITKPVLVVIAVSMIILAKQFFIKSKKEMSSKLFFAISLPIMLALIMTDLNPSIFIVAMIVAVLIFVKEDRK